MKLFWSTALCMSILLLAGCEEQKIVQTIRPVKAMQVKLPENQATRVFPGKVDADTEVNLAFRVAGQIHNFPVKVGEYVRKGQLVARLDTTDYVTHVHGLEAQLAGAKAALRESELQYKRYAKLVAEKTASQASYDQAKATFETGVAKVNSLRAQLRKAKSDLGYASLVAPFSGYVSAKHVDNYETVQAGTPIIKLQDIANLDVTVGLPDELVARREHIIGVSISLEAFPGKVFTGTIKEIATDASQQTRTYPATINFERPKGLELLPGMAANVALQFNGGSLVNGILIPETAVFSDDSGKSKVWVFDAASSSVKMREVILGEVTSGGVYVSSGISVGEWVVTAGVHFLQPDQKVRLLNQKG